MCSVLHALADCQPGPGLGSNLMRALQETGDQLLFMRRPYSFHNQFMSWAQNKLQHVNVEWESPATGQRYFSLTSPPSQQPTPQQQDQQARETGKEIQEQGGAGQEEAEEEEQVRYFYTRSYLCCCN